MTENLEKLRDKDRAVLQHISEGKDDTHQITQATVLEAHEVRYSLKKLEELGLIDLEKPEGMVERVVNGQKRVFKAPLQARLTSSGEEAATQDVAESLGYENLSREELVKHVNKIDDRLENLENSFEVFRRQIQRRLE